MYKWLKTTVFAYTHVVNQFEHLWVFTAEMVVDLGAGWRRRATRLDERNLGELDLGGNLLNLVPRSTES